MTQIVLVFSADVSIRPEPHDFDRLMSHVVFVSAVPLGFVPSYSDRAEMLSAEEIGIIVIVLGVWMMAIMLFFNRWAFTQCIMECTCSLKAVCAMLRRYAKKKFKSHILTHSRTTKRILLRARQQTKPVSSITTRSPAASVHYFMRLPLWDWGRQTQFGPSKNTHWNWIWVRCRAIYPKLCISNAWLYKLVKICICLYSGRQEKNAWIFVAEHNAYCLVYKNGCNLSVCNMHCTLKM